jgi:uncharacterized protein (DUF697 family)
MAEEAQTVQTKQITKTDVKKESSEAKKEKDGEVPGAAPAEPKPIDLKARTAESDAVIQRNTLWALGAGIVPFPIFDLVAITGIQVKMLKEMSDVYGVTFRTDVVKKSIGALASGLGSVAIGTALGSSLAKLIPAVGQTLGVITMPIVAAAFTRATGRIFQLHLEAGGTILDFDAAHVREHFKQEFEHAKVVVAEMQKKDKTASS